jgi:hypothetical protein
VRLVNKANTERLSAETAFARRCLRLSLGSSVVLEKLLIGNRFPMLFEGLAHCRIQASSTGSSLSWMVALFSFNFR